MLGRVVPLIIALWLGLVGSARRAEPELRAAGVLPHLRKVEDLRLDERGLWVAYSGGLVRYGLDGRVRSVSTGRDGLAGGRPLELLRGSSGQLQVQTEGALCSVEKDGAPEGEIDASGTGASDDAPSFACVPRQARTRPLRRLAVHDGARITARQQLAGHVAVGTTRGAYLDGRLLGAELDTLPGPHVTALAVFRGRLFLGTFNDGLAREVAPAGALPPHLERLSCGPSPMVNALIATAHHLYVGTSEGLFRTRDGARCTRVDLVEDGVVGLAFDGTSVWASSPGALYRVRDRGGPRSDVWWLPGGSRSLQKLGAAPGHVWVATEDRGVVHMATSPTTVAKHRPFEVFDLGSGRLPTSWALSAAAVPPGAAGSPGGALVATLRGGLFFIGEGRTPTPIVADLSPWGLTTLAAPTGTWVGTQDGGAFVPHEAPGKLARIHDLPDERVHAFAIDPGRSSSTAEFVWIGTENGLTWVERER